MSKRILFLDDDETRHQSFAKATVGHIVTHVRTVEECKSALLSMDPFDLVSLDHDLGGQTFVSEIDGTGTEVALFIRDELPAEKLPGRFIVHSFNPVGALRMIEYIKDRGVWTRYQPFRAGVCPTL